MNQQRIVRGRYLFIIALIVAAAGTRLVEHPWNIAPVTAIALFGGAFLARWWQAVVVCLSVMILSDLALSMRPNYSLIYPEIAFVYGAFVLSVGLGLLLRGRKRQIVPIVGVTLAASIQFFIVTNFGLWLMSSYYPHTWAGLGECFLMAVPFFRNTLIGDQLFTLALFAAAAWAVQSASLRSRAASQANLQA